MNICMISSVLFASSSGSGRLGDAPEERQRSLWDATDILVPGVMLHELAERSVDDVIERHLVDPACRGFLLFKGAGVIPGRDLGFDGPTVRPAEEPTAR